MGVQGLLQLLKPALRDCNLSQFRGQTASVDIMTWLYKGAYAYSYELGLDQQTLGFLAYPLKMLKLVQTYGIKPICVFDGQHLKAKEATEKVRSHNKQVNKELAMQKAEDGNEEDARKYFMRSLILRSKMIDLFIDILKKLEIEMVVAPYEADSQIAYMVKEGIADFAISEDSDLIAYGCPKLLMKLNFNGYCKVFSINDFKANNQITDQTLAYLQKTSREQFVQICIMAGCEYLPSIQQVGLKVAIKLFMKNNGDVEQVLESLKTNKIFKDRVPEGYLSALKKVQQLFFYQTVFDTRIGKLTSLEKFEPKPAIAQSPVKQNESLEELKQEETQISTTTTSNKKQKQSAAKKSTSKSPAKPVSTSVSSNQNSDSVNFNPDELDLEYMGQYIPEHLLQDFASGRLKKSSMTLRDNYINVIDFKKIFLDYIDNQISERSFICVDKKFFNSDFQQSDRLHGQQIHNQDNGQEEEKKQSNNRQQEVHQPAGLITERKKLVEDDLGFCMDEDSSDNEDNFLYASEKENEHSQIAEIKAKQINMDNKFLQNDFAYMSTAHAEIQERVRLSQEYKNNFQSNNSGMSTPQNNKFSAMNVFAKNSNIQMSSQKSLETNQIQQLSQNKEIITSSAKGFKKFDQVLPVLLKEEEKKDKTKSDKKLNTGKISDYSAAKNQSSPSKVKQESAKNVKQANKKRKLDEISKTEAKKASAKSEKPNGKSDSFFGSKKNNQQINSKRMKKNI
eukprot:403348528